jgi:hypothetical protein
VSYWIKKYGSNVLPKPIIIQSASEVNRLKEQEKEIVSLKQVIAEMHLEMLVMKKYIEIAKEELGADFKKKIGEKR